MSFMSPASIRTQFLRGKTPGAIEFASLLNQLSEPALVLDLTRRVIAFANSALVNLTAYTYQELGNLKFSDLVLEDGLTRVEPGDERTVSLKCNNRPYIQAALKAAALDPNGQWMLVTFVPDYARLFSNWQEMVIHAMPKINELYNAGSLEEALPRAVEIVQSLFFLNFVAIYRAESDPPRLRREVMHEAAPFFPEYLPSTDLMRLSTPEMWMPGKRASAELHRVARGSNLSFLASVPLGQNGAWFGLLVIGDHVGQPHKLILEIMEIIASTIGSLMQHFILVTNLRSAGNRSEYDLAVHQVIAENVQEGILFLDTDLCIIEINPIGEEILGYTRQEVIGQPAENIMIGSPRLQPALEEARQGNPVLSIGEDTQLHRRNGQAFPARVQILPVVKDGRTFSLLVFLVDDSEHEQIKTRTQQLQQRAFLGELMGVFSHEVGNPLNNLALQLQVLAASIPENENNQELINRMLGDISRLKNLMDSILASAKPMEPRFEEMDFSVFLKRLLDRWRPRLARDHVELFYKAPEKIPQIRGDPRTLDQVFTNLISNAVDAMGKNGGMLSVGVEVIEDRNSHRPLLDVTVADNGPGIPDENRERIFEPFVTTKSRGTGLGLAITKRIMIAHHGNIQVQSFPGGTVFHLYFPTIREGD